MKKITFKKNPEGPNEIYNGDGFYLSYNPKVNDDAFRTLAEIIVDKNFIKNPEETALVVDGKWFILNGDFRKEYADAYDGNVDSLIAFYKENSKFRSDWSTD